MACNPDSVRKSCKCARVFKSAKVICTIIIIESTNESGNLGILNTIGHTHL